MGSGAVVVTRWEWGGEGKPEWQKSAFYTPPPPSPPPPPREQAGLKGTAGLGGESQWASGDPQGRAGRTSEHEETECIQLVLMGGR